MDRKKLKYNYKSWEFDLTSKRIIAWLSNHNLTYENSMKNIRKNLTHDSKTN